MMAARVSSDVPPLTRRQYRVALLVSDGCSNAEIAHRLDISEQTVKNHLKAIFQRLGVTSRLQLAAFVHKYRLGHGEDGS